MNTKVIKENWGENHEHNSESSQSIQQARIKSDPCSTSGDGSMMVALALAVVVLVIIICILLVAFAEQRVQYETRILNLQKEHKQFLEELNRRIEDMRAENL